MRRAWDRWAAWLATPEPATSLALFRIGVGVSLLTSALSAIAAGVVDVLWLPEQQGGLGSVNANWLLRLLGGPSPGATHGLLATVIVASVLLIVGIGGRVTALVALQAGLALFDGNAAAGGSYDELTYNALWLLVLAGGTQTLALDARLRTGRWATGATVGRWARFLVVFQIVLVYTSTGWQKLSVHWVPGGGSTALYYILQQPTWQRWDMAFLAWEPWYSLTRIGTAVTWWWEVLGPLGLVAWLASLPDAAPGRIGRFANRIHLRPVWAGIGLALHLLIAATMEVGTFSLVSLAFYACVVHPSDWDRLARRRGGIPASDGSPRAAA